MKETIWVLSEFVDFWHDLLLEQSRSLGWGMTDTELHFWIIGALGLIGLLFVNVIFHALAKLSITAISFLFSLAMVIVFVFALEIEQKISGSGSMEFSDAVAGLAGFLAFCLVYFTICGLVKNRRVKVRRNEDGTTYWD